MFCKYNTHAHGDASLLTRPSHTEVSQHLGPAAWHPQLTLPGFPALKGVAQVSPLTSFSGVSLGLLPWLQASRGHGCRVQLLPSGTSTARNENRDFENPKFYMKSPGVSLVTYLKLKDSCTASSCDIPAKDTQLECNWGDTSGPNTER